MLSEFLAVIDVEQLKHLPRLELLPCLQGSGCVPPSVKERK